MSRWQGKGPGGRPIPGRQKQLSDFNGGMMICYLTDSSKPQVNRNGAGKRYRPRLGLLGWKATLMIRKLKRG